MRRVLAARAATRRRTALLVVLLALATACTGAGGDPDPEAAAPPEASTGVAKLEPTDDLPPAEELVRPVHPPPAAAPAPPSPPPASRPQLTASLERLLREATTAAPELELGVIVLDEAGREVVAIEPDRPLLPASTLKQVTAAAALTTLGPAAQLRTVVDATAGIGGDGVLDGDLVLIGSGDPTLVTDEYARFIYPARPRTPLASLADQLVEAGLTHVTGSVRGTAPAFAPPSLPTGWKDGYLSSLDGRYGAGLTVDGGLRTVIELPELPDDDAAAGDEDVEPAPEVTPATPPRSVLDQLAELDSDVPPTVRVSLAEDPTLHTAVELTRLLLERGVLVDGEATVLQQDVPTAARLAVVSSPPLEEILRFAVQRSDNHLADALALTVARTRTGEGSWPAAGRAFRQVLDRFSVPADGAVFADGSGLSRDDRVSPRLLAELDRRLTVDRRFGASWRSLQAVAGRSGTLDRRLRGTPAEGRLLAKTGTLQDVSALSGQVISREADPAGAPAAGERSYHLAVIGNEADGAARGVVRALVDELVLALVADLDGCRLVPTEQDDGPLARPPSEIRCDVA